MKVRSISHIIAGVVVLMLLSCSRDHLYYEAVSRNQVQLNIDWSQTAFSQDSRNFDSRTPPERRDDFRFRLCNAPPRN